MSIKTSVRPWKPTNTFIMKLKSHKWSWICWRVFSRKTQQYTEWGRGGAFLMSSVFTVKRWFQFPFFSSPPPLSTNHNVSLQGLLVSSSVFPTSPRLPQSRVTTLQMQHFLLRSLLTRGFLARSAFENWSNPANASDILCVRLTSKRGGFWFWKHSLVCLVWGWTGGIHRGWRTVLGILLSPSWRSTAHLPLFSVWAVTPTCSVSSSVLWSWLPL